MLGKLIKYDFRALNHYLVVIHIMLLITAVLGRFLFVGKLMRSPERLSDMGIIVVVAGIFLYVILFMTAVFGTLLMIVLQFYKSLYSDEGYLTHTLPVTRGQLLIAKTVSGSVWMFVDVILVILSIAILVLQKPIVQELAEQEEKLLEEMGFPSTVGYGIIFFFILLMLVVSSVANVLTLYVSVAIGQLFANHRVLGAIVVYFSISTVLGIAGGSIGAAYSVSAAMNATNETFVYQLYHNTYLFSMVLELITAVGFYAATYFLMQRKLNLS